jgi:Fe-S cluster assembly protein SufD
LNDDSIPSPSACAFEFWGLAREFIVGIARRLTRYDMLTTLTATGFNNEMFNAFLSARREPAWLVTLRREAWEKFQDVAWPDSTNEEWRRTDIRLFRLDKFTPPKAEAAATGEPPKALLAEGVELAGQSTTMDSQPSRVRSADRRTEAQREAADGPPSGPYAEPALAKQGVLFGSLDQLVHEHGDLIRPYLLTRAVDPGYDKFAALHAAFWSGGTFLYVPRGVAIEKPLHILSAMGDGAVDFGHTLIVLEEDAEATLMAETAGGGNSGLHCGAVEIIVGRGARLRYVNLQNWDKSVWHFAHHKALVEQDGRIQWTIGALGSRLSKVNQHVALTGPGAEAQVNGVMFTEGRQHLNYHTLQHHEAPVCKSDLLYKGALQDESRVVWRGMIKVDPGAQKTDGYQRDDNLMLSDHARADSIPGLEIEADDVRCTHGATTSRVDDEPVFYLRSRGLTRHEAVRMIVAGFFQQVFDRITIESVREALGQAIGRRIREYD